MEFTYLEKGAIDMSAQLDSLIRKGKDLETQIEHLTAELARLHWEINKDLLLDELSREALDYCKEVVLTKTKLDQAVKAGYLPPRLYDRAVRREQLGWNVHLKILEPAERAFDWEREEER
jgi:hypothetical protein